MAFPEAISADALRSLQKDLIDTILSVKHIGSMQTSQDTKELWEKTYLGLSRNRDGLADIVCNRAEPQTLRLSMIYALLDRSDTILPSHLESALAFWRYCEKSAQFIFAQQESDPKKNRIVAALMRGPRTTTELHRLFCGHLKKNELNKILIELQINARIEIEKVKMKGKPRTLFKLARIPSEMRQMIH